MSATTSTSRRAFLRRAVRWFALGAAAPGAGWLFACAHPGQLEARRLRALGTEVTLLVRSRDPRRASRAMHRALREVAAMHQDFSLFEPSALRSFNRRARSRAAEVPDWLREVLTLAIDVHEQSGGLFDPALGGLHDAPPAPQAAPAGSMRDVELGAELSWLRLHGPRTALDLNSIAKGVAVDRAAAVLRDHGLGHFVVNAGGDLLASGDASDDEAGWPIRLQRGQQRRALTLHLRDRAVATSGNHGRGRARGTPHLVDPLRLRAVDPLRSATALAPTAALADAWATALFVASAHGEQARPELPQGLRGLWIQHGGEVVTLETT